MEITWQELYDKAVSYIKQKTISPFINVGYIACAILSDEDKVYVGTNIVSKTAIEMSAEANAISKMIAEQNYIIKKMVIVNELGELLMPCEECYEYLLDFCHQGDLEILEDLKKEKTFKIKELLPDWWGTFRIGKEND